MKQECSRNRAEMLCVDIWGEKEKFRGPAPHHLVLRMEMARGAPTLNAFFFPVFPLNVDLGWDRATQDSIEVAERCQTRR